MLIFSLVNTIILALTLAIFASVILSWLRLFGVRISSYNPVVQVIEQTADLILRPIRRMIPASAGGLDFSPIIALILLQVIGGILSRLIRAPL